MSDSLVRDSGGWLSPVIRRIEIGGRSAILKDYRDKSFLVRTVLGPLMVRREHRVLKLLDGVRGVPATLGIVERAALALEFIEGQTSSKFRDGALPPGVLDELSAVIRGIHERGVVHMDLRQKKNILITPEGHPVVVDFGAALAPRVFSPLRLLMPLFRRIDRGALLKFKLRQFPSQLSDSDHEALSRQRFWRRFWPFTPRGRHVR